MIVAFMACVGYLVTIGVLFYFVGEGLPREHFDAERAPFRCMAWERGGAVYEGLAIRRWKDRLPDMSRVMPEMLPKRLGKNTEEEQVERLIQETCVAELIHVLLILAGFGCLLIWQGTGVVIVLLLWIAGNIPYVLIQRYNRPRLQRLARRLARLSREGAGACTEKPLRHTSGS